MNPQAFMEEGKGSVFFLVYGSMESLASHIRRTIHTTIKAVILYLARRKHQNTTLAPWEKPDLKTLDEMHGFIYKNNIYTIDENYGHWRKKKQKKINQINN